MKTRNQIPSGMTMFEKAAWLKGRCDRFVLGYANSIFTLRGKRPHSKVVVARAISAYLHAYLSPNADLHLTDRDIDTALDIMSPHFLSNVQFQEWARGKNCLPSNRIGILGTDVSDSFYNAIHQAINDASDTWKNVFPNAKYANKTPSEALQPTLQNVTSHALLLSLVTLLFNRDLNSTAFFATSFMLCIINGELSDNLAYLMHSKEERVVERMSQEKKAEQLLKRCHEKIAVYSTTKLNLFGYRKSIHLELLKAITLYLEAYLYGGLQAFLSEQISECKKEYGARAVSHLKIKQLVKSPLNDRDIDFVHELIGQQYQLTNNGLINWINKNKPQGYDEIPGSKGFGVYFELVSHQEMVKWRLYHPKAKMLLRYEESQSEFIFSAVIVASVIVNLCEMNPISIALLLTLAGLVHFSGEIVDNFSHLTSFRELPDTQPTAPRFSH